MREIRQDYYLKVENLTFDEAVTARTLLHRCGFVAEYVPELPATPEES